MLEHTGMNKDEILMLSIPEIEGILEGFNANNTVDGESKQKSPKLEDQDALKYLIAAQGGV